VGNSIFSIRIWLGEKIQKQKMLREINHDNMTPKKHDFYHQNEIHEKIRNDEDYDDWDYGTEPTYGSIKG
jgi:hypothetical protein